MKLPSDFSNTLAEKSEEELYQMLARTEDYVPEAIEATRNELRRRNVPPEKAAQLEAGIQARLAQETRLAEEPLNGPIRLFILFGICPALFLAAYFHVKGHKRKVRETFLWMLYAYLFWIGLALFVTVVRNVFQE